MEKLTYAAMCLYYYGSVAARLAVMLLAMMALLFMIHKLVSWSIWILTL